MKFSYAFPPMDEFTLTSGLNVICVPDHEQSGCVIALQLPVGRFSDPPEREGLCELTAGLLAKGTETLAPEAFAEKFESAGATLFSNVDEEYSVIGMRMLASSADSLLPLFVDMMIRPRFAKEEFSRLQREMITGLRAEAVDPHFLSSRHFYAELTGGGHPAGRFQTIRSLKKITLNDARNFFDDCFSPQGSLCVIGGDYHRGELKRFAAEQLSAWIHPRKKKGAIAQPVRYPGATTVRLVDKPDLTQTSLAVGHAAPGETCPAMNALLLANHIVGGGNFSSRLMARIRAAAGKTYTISSQLNTETGFGAFMITTSTLNGDLGGVLSGILEEYRRFCKDGVTADELEKARRFATGNMAFQLEGIGNVVDKLLWLRFYGRRNSYLERFEETIAAIDVAAVNDAIRTYLSPDHLIIVAVGKKTEIQSQLKPFGVIRNYHFRDKL
jgi:zinc protease